MEERRGVDVLGGDGREAVVLLERREGELGEVGKGVEEVEECFLCRGDGDCD